MESKIIKRLSFGTVYKLILLGLLVGLFPLCLFFGFLAFLGYDTVQWNGESITGVKALFAGPLMGIFLSFLFTAVIGSFVALGLWIFSFFRPLSVVFKKLE